MRFIDSTLLFLNLLSLLPQFVIMFVVLFFQTVVLALQAVVLNVGILDAIAEDGVASNKHQHYQDDSNCESQGNDEGCIHVRNFLITGAKLQTDSETGVSLSEKFVSNSEKMQKKLILLQFCSCCLPVF